MPFPDGIEVECIRDESAFAQLREVWNGLISEHPGTGAFLSHEWFSAAWQWARLDSELHILQIRGRGGILGFLPLLLRDPHGRGRQLEFLSVPDTQFCDFVCREEDRHACINAAAAYLARHRHAWDLLLLRYLASGTPTAAALPGAMRERGIRSETRSGGTNPYVDLDGTWEAYYRGCSRRMKKGNNLAASRLQRAGDIRIEWFRPDSHDGRRMHGVLESITAVSARSWKGETAFSLDRPGPAAFLRHLSESALERGWLSVWILYLSDAAIAMEYQIIHEGMVHALRADFDSRYSQLSPGSYLNWKILEQLFESGFRRYYMGPGDNAYKRRWTQAGEAMTVARCFSPSLRGGALAIWQLDIKPRLRRIRTLRPQTAAKGRKT